MTKIIPKKQSRNIKLFAKDMVRFCKALGGKMEEIPLNDKAAFWSKAFCTADISVIFPQFFLEDMAEISARKKRQRYDLPLLTANDSSQKRGKPAKAKLMQECLEIFKENLPGRADMCEMLIDHAFQKLAGVDGVRSPLLIGSPGVGKTQMATSLAKSLRSAGINTALVIQSMTAHAGENNNSVEMSLLGSAAHYSNADMGSICKKAISKDIDLCIVLLDEADKGAKNQDLLNLMINLTDPGQPLQDYCACSLWEGMDMRSKTLFILTANEAEPLQKNRPLWNRLAPVEVAPYTKEETIKILTAVGMKKHAYSGATKRQCSRIAKKIIENCEKENNQISLREHISTLKEALWAENTRGKKFDFPSARSKTPCHKRSIGFTAQWNN